MFKDINFSVCCSYLTGLEAVVHTDPICSQVGVLSQYLGGVALT